MAILNRFSAILLYCDSAYLLLLAAEFLAIVGLGIGRFAIRDFCAAKSMQHYLQSTKVLLRGTFPQQANKFQL